MAKDAYGGAYIQHQLARVYVMAGAHEAAVEVLEMLLGQSYYLSPEWLRVDPTFAPLRENARFRALLVRGLELREAQVKSFR